MRYSFGPLSTRGAFAGLRHGQRALLGGGSVTAASRCTSLRDPPPGGAVPPVGVSGVSSRFPLALLTRSDPRSPGAALVVSGWVPRRHPSQYQRTCHGWAGKPRFFRVHWASTGDVQRDRTVSRSCLQSFKTPQPVMVTGRASGDGLRTSGLARDARRSRLCLQDAWSRSAPARLEPVAAVAVPHVEPVPHEREHHGVRAVQQVPVFDGLVAHFRQHGGRAPAIPADTMPGFGLGPGGIAHW